MCQYSAMASHDSLLSVSVLIAINIFLGSFSLSTSAALNNGGFSVDLIHRDSPDSPFYNSSETPLQRTAKAVRRSINRVNHFKPSTRSSTSPKSVESEIIPDKGEYLMKYSVGTPPVPVLGIADTGSDLIWLQCKPCTDCYKQAFPIFDPGKSKTFKKVACNSRECDSLEQIAYCSPASSSCVYSMFYGDQSFTNGDLAFDTLTLGSSSASGSQPASFRNIVIGCGHLNGGDFSGDGSGIIGLGGGMVSLVSQLGSSVDGKFSYCLVPLDSTRSSRMSFGSDAIVSGPEVVSTPLVSKNPDTFYFLTLEAMSVGNKRLELGYSSPFGNTKEGNIIIDSGTTLTVLPAGFYTQFESAVAEQIEAERTRDPGNVLSLCYKSASDNIGVPIITAHFRGADVQLNQLNTFVRLGKELLCLAFRPDESLSIFGSLAQTSFLVGYDLKEKTVSFMPSDCNRMHM
ncbi:aspartic proteinase CDR1-like [Juglans microcarpa x Juglans regia]|uniref:aspartic proteinase CDR1-like n=1 Tax=Juglans microcarpa x Juglans regia TaxID=2249226 RepID=UPI001B7DD96B|nr:aspartic proteinase CDR1-like [Juglans microcarpa x Juglans regia]